MATKTQRFEMRLDQRHEQLIKEAARRSNEKPSDFVRRVATERAEEILALSDVTFMDPAVFDVMLASLDTPDEVPAALLAAASGPRPFRRK